MPAYRFPILLCQDLAGLHTALLVERDDDYAGGFGTTAAAAVEQLREYLSWQYRREPERPAPTLQEAQLTTVKVSVRPEYEADGRIYACDNSLTLPVHCVNGRLAGGLLVAALPLLDIRFYYHEPE